MKTIIFTLIILFTGSSIAQTFQEIDQGVFIGAQYPSIAIANIDAELNDTQEIIINGNGVSAWRTHLYP